jgi:UDP-N-acetylmuramate--alanine ligase
MLLALMHHENKHQVSKTDIPAYFEGKEIEIIITMGAGDIDTLVEPIENYLKNK